MRFDGWFPSESNRKIVILISIIFAVILGYFIIRSQNVEGRSQTEVELGDIVEGSSMEGFEHVFEFSPSSDVARTPQINEKRLILVGKSCSCLSAPESIIAGNGTFKIPVEAKVPRNLVGPLVTSWSVIYRLEDRNVKFTMRGRVLPRIQTIPSQLDLGVVDHNTEHKSLEYRVIFREKFLNDFSVQVSNVRGLETNILYTNSKNHGDYNEVLIVCRSDLNVVDCVNSGIMSAASIIDVPFTFSRGGGFKVPLHFKYDSPISLSTASLGFNLRSCQSTSESFDVFVKDNAQIHSRSLSAVDSNGILELEVTPVAGNVGFRVTARLSEDSYRTLKDEVFSGSIKLTIGGGKELVSNIAYSILPPL